MWCVSVFFWSLERSTHVMHVLYAWHPVPQVVRNVWSLPYGRDTLSVSCNLSSWVIRTERSPERTEAKSWVPQFSHLLPPLYQPCLSVRVWFLSFPGRHTCRKIKDEFTKDNGCEALGLHISFRWWQSVKNGLISRAKGDFLSA